MCFTLQVTTSKNVLKMFYAKTFFRAVDFPRLCHGRQNVSHECRHVFNMLKHLQKCFATFLQMF